MKSARLLFVISAQAGLWSVPGLEPTHNHPRVIGLDGWCAWRLVGGNNREIARSASIYGTFQECYEAARRVQLAVPSINPVLRHDDVENRWAWRVQADPRAGASSGRMYHRYRECLFNVRQFLDLMPAAVTAYDSEVVLPRVDGPASALYIPAQVVLADVVDANGVFA
jgi:hypothetical protein